MRWRDGTWRADRRPALSESLKRWPLHRGPRWGNDPDLPEADGHEPMGDRVAAGHHALLVTERTVSPKHRRLCAQQRASPGEGCHPRSARIVQPSGGPVFHAARCDNGSWSGSNKTQPTVGNQFA